MREILFKAKRIDNGEWIEGSLINLDADSGYCYIVPIFKNASTLPVGLLILLIVDSMALVDPETLCQFTGLTDKNGKKVFENDILKAHLDDDYPEDITFEKVEWNNFGWTLHEPGCIDWGYIDTSDSEIYEVAGNIFDNPELLQEDTE